MPSREEYQRRKTSRLCVRCCAGLLPEWRGVMCPECKERHTATVIRSQKRNRATFRAQQRRVYLALKERALSTRTCWLCGGPNPTGKLRCQTCTADFAEWQREHRAAARKAVG